ncbi:beta-phosphoglucomutase, partial [Candidatus Acetothermia bacterium]
MPKAGAPIAAVILDLDGVITDTAEHHYRAWRQLAEELGIPCPPDLKDRVRGVSRRRSLDIVLAGRAVDEKEAEELMARKNRYYQELIQGITPADLLPGAGELLAELRASGVKVAVATVSRNAEAVLARLGIRRQLDALVDGNAGVRSKPAPDLFLRAAALLEVPPGRCLVIEDAAAGIAGAKAAGMWAVGLGPKERFREVYPDLVLPSLAGVSWGGLQA